MVVMMCLYIFDIINSKQLSLDFHFILWYTEDEGINQPGVKMKIKRSTYQRVFWIIAGMLLGNVVGEVLNLRKDKDVNVVNMYEVQRVTGALFWYTINAELEIYINEQTDLNPEITIKQVFRNYADIQLKKLKEDSTTHHAISVALDIMVSMVDRSNGVYPLGYIKTKKPGSKPVQYICDSNCIL